MHHVDIHVRNLRATRALFDAVMPLVGYELRSSDDDFASYWRAGERPSIGFIEDRTGGSAQMRIALAVAEAQHVDAVAKAAASHGAQQIEGPSFHPEYGVEYYAVFFEDTDGNKFEVVRDPDGI